MRISKIIALLLLVQSVHALEVKEVVSVYDIDTFFINIPDIPPIFGKRLPIRINGIDGPEIKGKCEAERGLAYLGRHYLLNRFAMANTIELKNLKRGKYFRIIADVYLDGESLTEDLLANGLARPYSGGKRKGWCPTYK